MQRWLVLVVLFYSLSSNVNHYRSNCFSIESFPQAKRAVRSFSLVQLPLFIDMFHLNSLPFCTFSAPNLYYSLTRNANSVCSFFFSSFYLDNFALYIFVCHINFVHSAVALFSHLHSVSFDFGLFTDK